MQHLLGRAKWDADAVRDDVRGYVVEHLHDDQAVLLLSLYKDGLLDLDGMVTLTYPLEDINQGYQDMHDGKNIRGVLVM